MKKLHIALIIGVLLYMFEAQAVVYAAAKLEKDGRTVFLLSDICSEDDIALKQRDDLFTKIREGRGRIAMCADDWADLQDGILRFPEAAPIRKKLEDAQKIVSNEAKSARRLLPGLVTLAESPFVLNMNYRPIVLRNDISLSDIRTLLDTSLASLSYLSPAMQGEFSQCKQEVDAITEKTKNSKSAKDALSTYTCYQEFLVVFDAVRSLANGASLIVCASAETISVISRMLIEAEWKGDDEQVRKLWSLVLKRQVALISERTEAERKLQSSLKVMRTPEGRKKLQATFNEKWGERSTSGKFNEMLHTQALTAVIKSGQYAPIDLKDFLGTEEVVSVAASSSSAAQSSVPVEVEPKEDEQELPEPKPWITVVLDELPVDDSANNDDNPGVSPDDNVGKVEAGQPLAAQSVPVEGSDNAVVPTIDTDNLNEADGSAARPLDASLAGELTLVYVPSGDDSEDNNEPTVKPSWFSANKMLVGCGVTAAVVAGCVLAYQNGWFNGLCKKFNSFGWF
jgi:hypothetical protein